MCMELMESVRFFFGWRSMLASPVLQIARPVFFQTQSRLKAQGSLQEQAFTFVSMCSLLTARCAVVHQTSCSEASSEPDHCEVNAITDQHYDPPKSSGTPGFA